MSDIIWVAYCTDCAKELESCPNGVWAEGVAKYHSDHENHRVLIGYYVEQEKEVK